MFSTFQPNHKPVDTRARLDRAGICLTFGLFGPLALFAPKGLWIPILLLLLVRSKNLTTVTACEYRRIFRQNALYLILPFYAFLSAAWAVVPADAAVTAAKLLGYFLAAVVVVVVVDRLPDTEKRSVLISTGAGLVIANLVALVDLGTTGAISDLLGRVRFTANYYSRGAVVSSFAVLPITVGLYRLVRPSLALMFAGFCVMTVFVLEIEAAKLALIFGIFIFAVVRWRGVLFWPVILLPLAAGIASPMIFANGLNKNLLCTIYDTKPSAAHRLIIYEYSSRNIIKKPVLGWGMDASRSLPGGDRMVRIHDCKRLAKSYATLNSGHLLPLHPHNASLQVWLELGVVGVAIFIGLLGALILRWERGVVSGDGRPLIAGLFTMIFLIYNISFGLWQGWLIFCMIILCATVRAHHMQGSKTE